MEKKKGRGKSKERGREEGRVGKKRESRR